jgi:50S ribosomal protein L16 3-hydroxylase
LTYSIGFRAPHQKELASAFGADLTERGDPTLRYNDPDLLASTAPGEIDAGTLARVRAMLDRIDRSDEPFAMWFGRFATEPKRERAEPEGEPEWTTEKLRTAFADPGFGLERGAPGRFAHYLHSDGTVSLFVGGDEYRLGGDEAAFGPLVTGAQTLDAAALGEFARSERLLGWIAAWIHHGYLFVPE